MRDTIEARADVSFQDPARALRFAQQEVTLCQSIRAASFQPKAVGMAVGQCFRDGVQSQQAEGLHGPIAQRGNPQWTFRAVALENVHSAERLRLIAVPAQSAESRR